MEAEVTNDHAEPAGQELPPLASDDQTPIEEKLIKMMEDGERTPDPKGEAVKGAAPDAGKTVQQPQDAATAGLFDLNGKLKLKVGDKLSPEHVKEFERGWLREADYTRKTQELATQRQEYQNTTNALNQIDKDPRALRSYMPEQKILAAFQPQELLNIGLSRAGVPVQLWNEFLEYHQQNAGNFAGQADQLRADPYQERFSKYDNEIHSLKQTLAGYEHGKQQDAYERQMSQLDQEVQGVIAKYPGVKREELLGRMVWDTSPGKTPETLAKAIADEKEAAQQEWLQGKELNRQKRVTAPTGTKVPIMPQQPKTFKEAEDMIGQAYGVNI